MLKFPHGNQTECLLDSAITFHAVLLTQYIEEIHTKSVMKLERCIVVLSSKTVFADQLSGPIAKPMDSDWLALRAV